MMADRVCKNNSNQANNVLPATGSGSEDIPDLEFKFHQLPIAPYDDLQLVAGRLYGSLILLKVLVEIPVNGNHDVAFL